jgi:hypothetical protein
MMFLEILIAIGLSIVGGQVAPSTSQSGVSGIVVTQGSDPQPVRRAVVSLWGGPSPLGYHTVTDDEGRFALDSMPPGRYTLSAARPGFVSIAYGATRPGWAGTPLVLAEGERWTNVRVLVARGAVLSGRVWGPEGRSLLDIEVVAERRTGRDVSLPRRYATRTDHDGAYRLFGLPAGAYVVSAIPVVSSAQPVDERAEAEVDAILARLRQGRPPDAAEPIANGEVGAAVATRFSPVYLGGAFNPDDAPAVTIAAGEERTGLDILLAAVPTLSIEGTVVGGTGSRIEVTLYRVSRTAVSRVASQAPDPDGKFRFSSAQPGNYILAARTNVLAPGVSLPPHVSSNCQAASSRVPLTGSDASDLVLALAPCPRLNGVISADSSNTGLLAGLGGFEVLLAPDLSSSTPGVAPMLPALRTGPEGQFTLGENGDLVPGSYVVRVAVPAPGKAWAVTSIVVDGVDVADAPLQIDSTAGRPLSMNVHVSDAVSSVSGRLEKASGQPGTEFTVILFPQDSTLWRQPFRRVVTARPAVDGTFEMVGMPPGNYHLAAIVDTEPGEWFAREFLMRIAPAAIDVAVGPGEHVVANVRITQGNPDAAEVWPVR